MKDTNLTDLNEAILGSETETKELELEPESGLNPVTEPEPTSVELFGVKITSNGHITESALRKFKAFKRQKKLADEEAKKIARDVSLLETAIISAMDVGKIPQPGENKLTARVKETKRNSPKWKDEALNLAGKLKMNLKVYEKAVLDTYRTVVRKLEVF